MSSHTSEIIFIAVGVLLVIISSFGMFKKSEAYAVINKNTTVCGDCLPTEEDPLTYTQQCTTYNSDGYALDQYSQTNICARCQQLPNRQLSCQSYAPITNKYVGSHRYQKECKSCLG